MVGALLGVFIFLQLDHLIKLSTPKNLPQCKLTSPSAITKHRGSNYNGIFFQVVFNSEWNHQRRN